MSGQARTGEGDRDRLAIGLWGVCTDGPRARERLYDRPRRWVETFGTIAGVRQGEDAGCRVSPPGSSAGYDEPELPTEWFRGVRRRSAAHTRRLTRVVPRMPCEMQQRGVVAKLSGAKGGDRPGQASQDLFCWLTGCCVAFPLVDQAIDTEPLLFGRLTFDHAVGVDQNAVARFKLFAAYGGALPAQP